MLKSSIFQGIELSSHMVKSSIYQGIEFSSHHVKVHFMTTQNFLITGI